MPFRNASYSRQKGIIGSITEPKRRLLMTAAANGRWVRGSIDEHWRDADGLTCSCRCLHVCLVRLANLRIRWLSVYEWIHIIGVPIIAAGSISQEVQRYQFINNDRAANAVVGNFCWEYQPFNCTQSCVTGANCLNKASKRGNWLLPFDVFFPRQPSDA